MSRTQLLLTPHYLPCTAYLAYIYAHPDLCLEVWGFYERQTYENRCYISTSQGVEKLIVPIQHIGRKQRYKEVKIDYSTPWHVKHMRTLATAYGKAPFYHVLADLLFPLLNRKPTFLLDLSIPILEGILRFLQLPYTLTMTSSYVAKAASDTLDMRQAFHPKKKGLDSSKFVPVYRHLFEHVFIPNLSVVDLLFCEGPYARALFKEV